MRLRLSTTFERAGVLNRVALRNNIALRHVFLNLGGRNNVRLLVVLDVLHEPIQLPRLSLLHRLYLFVQNISVLRTLLV